MKKGDWITHRRSSGHFGFGLRVLCGAEGQGLHATSNARHVDCPKCEKLIRALRAKVKQRLAAIG